MSFLEQQGMGGGGGDFGFGGMGGGGFGDMGGGMSPEELEEWRLAMMEMAGDPTNLLQSITDAGSLPQEAGLAPPYGAVGDMDMLNEMAQPTEPESLPPTGSGEIDQGPTPPGLTPQNIASTTNTLPLGVPPAGSSRPLIDEQSLEQSLLADSPPDDRPLTIQVPESNILAMTPQREQAARNEAIARKQRLAQRNRGGTVGAGNFPGITQPFAPQQPPQQNPMSKFLGLSAEAVDGLAKAGKISRGHVLAWQQHQHRLSGKAGALGKIHPLAWDVAAVRGGKHRPLQGMQFRRKKEEEKEKKKKPYPRGLKAPVRPWGARSGGRVL